MSDTGVKIVFEKDACKMIRGAMVLMRGIKAETLYKLLRRINENNYLPIVNPKTDDILSCVADWTVLWHRRLGHINKNGLCTMHSKAMVKDILDCSSKFDFYEHCIYGKKNRVSFPSKVTRAKGILELVHSDEFGLVSIPSVGGYRYYVSFIDDFSTMTWIYIF